MGLKVLSLFDGIACGMEAFKQLGTKIDKYYSSEIDDQTMEIALNNHPSIVHIGDVRNIDFTKYKDVDVIIGGSPCTNLSMTISKPSGMTTVENVKVKTLEEYITLKESGTIFSGQSYLFWEFVNAVKTIKPKYFFLENVKMQEEWEKIITNALGVEPIIINSSLVSPQSRVRYYWTNIKHKLPNIENKKVLNNVILPLSNVNEKYIYTCDFDFHGEDKIVCATLHIKGHDILKRVNSRYSKSPTLTRVTGGSQQKKVYQDGKCRKLTPLEYERLQGLPDGYTNGFSDTIRYCGIGNGWEINTIKLFFSNISL